MSLRHSEGKRLNNRIKALLERDPNYPTRMMYERLNPSCSLGAFSSRVSLIKKGMADDHNDLGNGLCRRHSTGPRIKC